MAVARNSGNGAMYQDKQLYARNLQLFVGFKVIVHGMHAYPCCLHLYGRSQTIGRLQKQDFDKISLKVVASRRWTLGEDGEGMG